MATISVPGGSYSSTFAAENVSVSTLENATFQNALINLFNQGFNNNLSLFVTNDPNAPAQAPQNLLASNLLVNQSPGTIVLNPSFNAFANEVTSGNVTVVGNSGGNQSILSGGGNFTFHAGKGESGTLLAAAGNTLFTAPGLAAGQWTVVLDGTTGANTVVAGSSSLYVQDAAGQSNLIFLGNNNDTAWIYGTDTIVGGAAGGTATVSLHSSGNVLVGNGGTLLVLDNGGSNTVYGGSGADTFVANSSGSQFFGGSGATLVMVEPSITGANYTAGTGNSTIYAFTGSSGTYKVGLGNFIFVSNPNSASTIDGAYGDNTALVFGYGGDVTFNGEAIGNILVASAANTTLNAAGSTGVDALLNMVSSGQSATLIGGSNYNLFIGSPGNATMQAGSGGNLFQFFNFFDGGHNLITNWSANDQIQLYGYSQSQVTESTVNGSTVITLSDGTTITIQNQSLASTQSHIKIV